ncbi:MAG: helix-turn-helix transcriptional regulator [Mangrovibacterium sp.]|nr:helix-turn-helix transcriptional regulator [Mangrovibacterium sp.]
MKHFTQEKPAYESGLELSQTARIETGRTNPTPSTIFRIARIMDV